MELSKAVSLLEQGLEAANKAGVYSLTGSTMLHNALSVLKANHPEEVEEVETEEVK